jgi:hypothetical protein
MLWQLGSAAPPSPSRHLLYQRQVVLPAQRSGQACVALDATVFAHTVSAGAADIRIYGRAAEREFEIPFDMTKCGPAPV